MTRLLVQDDRLEEILRSLDGIQRAECPPFLYGKILSRLRVAKPEKNRFHLQPVLSLSIVLLVIIFEVIVFVSHPSYTSQKSDSERYGIETDGDFEETLFYSISDNEYLSYY